MESKTGNRSCFIVPICTMCTLKGPLIQQAKLDSLNSNSCKDYPSERESLDMQERRWRMCPDNIVGLGSMRLKALCVRHLGCTVLAY